MCTQLAQAGCVSTYIEERKNHEKKHNRYNMERLGTNVREIEKYETTLKRVVLTTDKKLLYQAEYNRKIRAAQRQQ